MRRNMIIVLGVIIVLAIIGIVAGTTLINDNNNDTNNATVNITNNTTQVNNTTNNTTTNTTKTTTAKKSGNDDPDVVSVSDQENLQAGDGSHYKEVEYADGNFRQYSYDGKLIGSSYDSDQDQLPSME